MAKALRDYLPPKVDTKFVQATCTKWLVLETQAQMKEDGITWRELIEAAMQRYLDEAKRAQKKAAQDASG